jgi:D-glycero-D-manno-heptose 1,7-bisphosphate phosphatase
LSKRAVFLDRDGTINVEVNYLSRVDDFELLSRAAEAIRALNQHDWRVIVITNQSGVARGYYTETTVAAIHDRMQRDLAEAGAMIDAIYYCPHQPDDACECRKPGTQLFEQAAREFTLDLAQCYCVGDKLSDLLPGRQLGCGTILVLTGHGREQAPIMAAHGFQPEAVADDLYEAVERILRTDEGPVRL